MAKKDTTKGQFEQSISTLSELTGLETTDLMALLGLTYPRQDISKLLQNLLKHIDRRSKQKLRLDLQKKNTRAVITALHLLIPEEVQSRPHEEQLDTIQSLLEIFGFTNARRFSLFAHPSEEPIIDEESVDLLSLADRWLTASNALLERHYTRKETLNDKQRLGILCIYLALHAGVGSRAEMQRALLQLSAGRVRRKGNLFWVSEYYEKKNMERCRTWVCQNTALLASSINWEKLGITPGSAPVAIRTGLATLQKLDNSAFARLNITRLLEASISRGFFQAELPAFLLAHMKGHISSSALPESVIARLMGCDTSSIDQAEVAITVKSDGDTDKAGHASEEGNRTTLVTRQNVITELSFKLGTKAPGAKKEIQKFITQARANNNLPGLIDQLLHFCSVRLTKVKPSTTKIDLDSLTARLLAAVTDLSAITDPEEWSELVQQMTEGLDDTSKSFGAITNFAKFLSDEIGEEFITVGSSASYRVNAQILTSAEVESASALLTQDLGQDLGKLAGLLLKLTYSTGLRRSEIDGLLLENIELKNTPTGTIRANDYRGLKTGNARRNIPFGYANEHFKGVIQDLATLIKEQSAKGAMDSQAFKVHGHLPLIDPHRIFNAISRALQEVTGDSKAKFHSLRHSFCCYLLLSLYYEELGLERFEDDIPYLKEIKGLGHTTKALLLPAGARHQFELATVRGLMGHLSETTTLAHYFHFCDLLRFAGFSNDETRLQLSQHAIAGALGYSQNNKKVAQGINNLAPFIESALSRLCTTLQPGTERAAVVKAKAIEETQTLHQDLLKLMAVAKSIHEGVQIQPPIVATDEFGPVPVCQIEDGARWLKSLFPPAFLKKNIANPFDPIEKATARSFLLTLLSNIQGGSPEQLTAIGRQLRECVFQHIGNSYLDYVFDDHAKLLDAAACLDTLLQGFPTTYVVKTTPLASPKLTASKAISVKSLSDVPKSENSRYGVIMKREDGKKFPHRPLIWLATALTLAADITPPDV